MFNQMDSFDNLIATVLTVLFVCAMICSIFRSIADIRVALHTGRLYRKGIESIDDVEHRLRQNILREEEDRGIDPDDPIGPRQLFTVV